MMWLRRIVTLPRRRWRAKGFGIHSPFAFDFVTRALAPKGKVAVRGWGKDGDLLYRCAVYLRPVRVAVMPGGSPTLTEILRAACPEIEIVGDDGEVTPDMTVVDAIAGQNLPDNGATVYFIAGMDKGENRALWERLTASGTHGMDFSDYRTGIICRYGHLPRQSFKIAYK